MAISSRIALLGSKIRDCHDVLPSKPDQFLSTIDVLWEKIAALIEFSLVVIF